MSRPTYPFDGSPISTCGPKAAAGAAAAGVGDISASDAIVGNTSAHDNPASRPLPTLISDLSTRYFFKTGSPSTTINAVVGRLNGFHSTVEPSFMVAMTL